MTKAEVYKKRYKILRELGFDSKTASKLRSRALDVSKVELTKKGVLKKNNETEKAINAGAIKYNIDKDYLEYVRSKNKKEYKSKRYILDNFEKYKATTNNLENDSVFSRWGMLTHDNRYNYQMNKQVYQIKKLYNLSDKQAWYLVYLSYTYNRPIDQLYREVSSNNNELWETYK